ncbi:MAG: MSMEG_4193 family putative phosphomutase [Anaerolineae bacterium]
MNLLLIRHALNDWTGKRMPGWVPGIHLNAEGRAQAAALPKRLAGVQLNAIYSSPLERTLETAQPLAEAYGLHVIVRDRLGEVRCGNWSGRSLEELQKEELWTQFRIYPGGVRFPGGESFSEAQARLVAELNEIRDAHPGQTVAIVSHADPIKLAVAYYIGLPLDLFHRLTIHPASITALAFTQWGPRLLWLNHTEPLPPFEIERGSKEGS